MGLRVTTASASACAIHTQGSQRRLISNMATAKDPGFLAHAAGQLNALQELWDDLEQRRAEASKLS
jgi:hypothetical protein